MSASALSIAICVILLATQCSARGALDVKVDNQPASAKPSRYQRLEWTIDIDRSFENPFDPDQIAVDAEFTGPAGQKLNVAGFWTQAFDHHAQGRRDRMIAIGKPHWAVRFCPLTPGTWTMRVRAKSKDDAGISSPVTFEIADSSAHGLVRRAPGNPRYFQFDDGSPFFLVGLNVCWGSLDAYEVDFAKLQSVGGNFARLWLSNRPIESSDTGIGKYDLANAAYYDAVLNIATAHDIYCMAALGTYGQLTEGGFFGEGKWNVNPYNAIHGGPATRPADAFQRGIARDYYKRYLRYLIARYGSFANLGFWEFWNEQDLAKGAITADWTCDMAAYLKAHDPYGRLVTTSFSGPGDTDVWACPDIDLTQSHIYGDHESLQPAMYDRTPSITSAVERDWKFDKPHLVGELGICWRDDDKHHDPANSGTNLHNGLWAAAFSGAAGGGSYWWWDNYVAPRDQWKQFVGFAVFVKTVDWPRLHFRPIDLPMPLFKDEGKRKLVDATIFCGTGSSRGERGAIDIRKDGTASAEVPGILKGPGKDGASSRVDLNLSVDRPTPMVIKAAYVIDHATLNVDVDHEPMASWDFDAAPGSPHAKDSHPLTGKNDVYRAAIGEEFAIIVPPGHRTVSLWVSSGDTLAVESIRLIEAVSARYTGLRVLALRDDAAGQIIAWINDRDSNCGTDAGNGSPRKYENATLVVPVAGDDDYRAAWWDTREGRLIQQTRSHPTNGKLTLDIPPFSRDIALRLSSNQ